LTLEGVPDASMVKRENAEELKKLTEAKAAMDETQLAELVKETADLKAEQTSVDSKEKLDTLPKLSLADLKKEDVDFDIHVGEKHGMTVLTHDVASAGIVYAQLILDMSVLPIDYIPLLPILMNLLFDVGASKFSAKEFKNEIGTNTGGISVGKMNALKMGKDGAIGDPNDLVFRLIVSGKAVADQAAKLFELMHMGIVDSKLDDKARVLETLKSQKSGMESSLRSSGSSYSSTRMYARRSLSGYFDELTSGITYYEALPALLEEAERSWPTLLAKLQSMNKLLLQKEALVINLSGDKQTLTKVDPLVDAFVKSLLDSANKSRADAKGPFVTDAMEGKPLLRIQDEDEGFVVPTPVNYVVRGGALFSEGDHVSGKYDVVVRLISQSYMWDKVRVMGGAYGGGCSVSHYSGTFLCYSYRDPNLKTTLDTFDAVATYLEKLKFSDGDVEQLIIGAVGTLDKPVSPSSKGQISMARWLLNDELEYRQKRRDEMLSTTAADFKEFSKLMRAAAKRFRNSIFGSKTAFAKANNALAEGRAIPLKKLQ